MSAAETSEDKIADTFSTEFKDRLKFDHEQGCWFCWDGARWARARKKEPFHHVRLVGRRVGDGKRPFSKASVASGVEAFARADPRHAVTADTWDKDPMLLGTPGGTVDLRTGRLRPAREDDYITKVTGCTPGNENPYLWNNFLYECTDGNLDQRSYLKRIAGYCLTGLTLEQALFFLYGPGGNGKSVFVNILRHVLGDYAQTAPMDAFANDKLSGHPEELAILRGTRLVAASETEEGRPWRTARIKNLTGNERITARFMYKSYFEFVPQCKLLFTGNHLPSLGSVDPAMRRRLRIVPFMQTPPSPDPGLEARLKEEAPQILRWIIEGCIEWQAKGLGECEAVSEATREYFEAQDTLGHWLSERCTCEATCAEQPKVLYDDWVRFAQSQGEPPGTLKAFSQAMKKRGFSSIQRAGHRWIPGLELRSAGFPTSYT